MINEKSLLEAGAHLGHKKRRVHPKSKKYIFKIENTISIIDLYKTKTQIDNAVSFVQKIAKEDKTLLFIATKRSVRDVIKEIAVKNGIPYLTNKWIGGFLTNFDAIAKNIKRFTSWQEDKNEGAWRDLPKHERNAREKKLVKILSVYEGVSSLKSLPDALFIIDIKKEKNAVNDAIKMRIPTIAIVDTNCDPSLIDYPIPANDDSIEVIRLIGEEIASAYSKAKSKRNSKN